MRVGFERYIKAGELRRLKRMFLKSRNTPVAQGTKATLDIEKLHVHRHFGIDILVITQRPNRMNKPVRDLVGRYVHVRRLLGMNRAMIYERDSVRNPSAGFRDAVKQMWWYAVGANGGSADLSLQNRF